MVEYRPQECFFFLERNGKDTFKGKMYVDCKDIQIYDDYLDDNI